VEITLLIQSIAGLVIVLAILLYLLLLPAKRAKLVEQKEALKREKATQNTDLNHLRSIIKNRHSSAKELSEAIDLILKYHGNIHPKLGLRPHPDFDIYMELIIHLCRHPHTNKHVILKFDKELNRLNPEYKQEINEAITKGLNSRGM
jgi:hypothetical protein